MAMFQEISNMAEETVTTALLPYHKCK